MSEDSGARKVLEADLQYVLEGACQKILSQGKARAAITEESLSIMPKYGDPLFFLLRDIDRMTVEDYEIGLTMGTESLLLSRLGRRFDDFGRQLRRMRHEVFITDLLMYERLRQGGLKGHASYQPGDEGRAFSGPCEIRLYETALVLLPTDDEPMRMPYGFMTRFEEADYSLTIGTQQGDTLVLSRLGRQFALLTRVLSAIINDLSVKVQEVLRELAPTASPAVVRQAAGLLRDGQAVKRQQLEALSPELWCSLEERLALAGLKYEYDHLCSVGRGDLISIGIKRGLLGEETGDYLWFLVPIYDVDASRPGNALALEAAAGEGQGRATYFFRIMTREQYRITQDRDTLQQAAADCIEEVNRCMIAVNFRREPIYLQDESLKKPHYQRYAAAVRKIPELRNLRRRFIGRVFHRSPKQWQDDVSDLLTFHVQATGEDQRWTKVESMTGAPDLTGESL